MITSPPSLRSAIAILGVLTAGCELTRMKWGSDASFELDRNTIRVGEQVEVSFTILKREPGWRYFVTLVPDATPLEDHSAKVEVPEGQRRIGLRAAAPGLHSVRVYRLAAGATRYLAGRKLTVTP